MPSLDEPAQEKAVRESITRRIKFWEDTTGKDFRTKYQDLYQQYRGFNSWREDWIGAAENDRDVKVDEARKRWGARLRIPLSFMAVETIVPRAIANQPHLTVLPRDERWKDNVTAVQTLLDWQQEQIRIELPFQAVLRSGLMYGLGIGKTHWDKKVRIRRRQEERPIPLPEMLGGRYRMSKPEEDVYFDGPRFESIHVSNFMWDPYGYDEDTCDWQAQRIWLSLEKVLERLGKPAWNTVSAEKLTEDDVRNLPAANKQYDEIWSKMMRESGFNTHSSAGQGEQIHEIIEYHNGSEVYTILDRQVLVSSGENPCGEMPFQIYRPVPLEHQMVGIGVLEPLTHLSREFDTMRSQRRDAVTLSLKSPTAYDDSRVRGDDIDFDPTGLIAVDGDPRSVFLQMPPKDVPQTSFEEEQAMRSDIKETAGLADAASATAATATEAQLAQTETSARIKLLSERFESEIVEPVVCQFLYHDQREIRAARTLMLSHQQGQQEAEDPDLPPYKAVQIDPGALMGEFEIKVPRGSLAQKNVPQERADAQLLLNAVAHDWYADPVKPRLEAWRKMGIERPEEWLRSQKPSIPLATLRILLKAGVPAELLQRAVITARLVEAPQQPSAEQVADMGGSAPQ